MDYAPLIEEIIHDNLSGSQELASRAGSIVCRLTEEKKSSPLEELRGVVLEVGGALLRGQPAMASLFNLFDRILPELDRASSGAAAARAVRRATQAFIVEMEEHNRKISAHLFDLVKKEGVIITHSASRSVREALRHCWKEGKRFSVICTESRPACEGVLLAGHLAKQGIPTTLTTDALCLSLMMSPPHGKKESRVVLVGADSVSLQGLTNKAGTLGLAMIAKNCSIPFYALAGSEKFLPSTFPVEKAIQERPPEEILSSPPAGLKIINRYFDVTSLPYLTAVVTEQGILPPKDLEEQLEKLTPHPQLITMLKIVNSK
jgi:translation initiation factor 2B subunit (eIF-2B alpha/beta/delta family)